MSIQTFILSNTGEDVKHDVKKRGDTQKKVSGHKKYLVLNKIGLFQTKYMLVQQLGNCYRHDIPSLWKIIRQFC